MNLSTKTEGSEYWEQRPSNDKRMDWRNGAGNWIEEYVASATHPHREVIIEALKAFYPFAGVLEAGCNAGPNLLRISHVFPETQLAGFDVNQDALNRAKDLVPKAIINKGSVTSIPFSDKSFDIGISDACLMYTPPEEIDHVLSEFDRVVRKALIFIEWYDPKGALVDHHWAYNFPELLKKYGFDTIGRPLTEEEWPHSTWVKNGRVFIAHRV